MAFMATMRQPNYRFEATLAQQKNRIPETQPCARGIPRKEKKKALKFAFFLFLPFFSFFF